MSSKAKQLDLPGIEPAPAPEPVQEQEAQTYYTKQHWRGSVDVFVCSRCDFQNPNQDDMIIHVVSHYQEPTKTQLLETLLKDKENS